MPEDFDQWITTAEAAELSGYRPFHLRRLAANGRIEAKKQGRDWFVNRDALLAYVAEIERLGRAKFDPWRTGARQREDEAGE